MREPLSPSLSCLKQAIQTGAPSAAGAGDSGHRSPILVGTSPAAALVGGPASPRPVTQLAAGPIGIAVKQKQPAKQKAVNYYEIWDLTAEDRLIMASVDYGVWLDKNGNLDWQTTDELDRQIEKKVRVVDRNAVFNQAAVLQAYPIDYLTRAQRDTIRVMVGEGLARLFELDPKSAMQMLEKAGEYAIARNQEVARVWYLCATGCATALFTLLLGIGWLFRGSLPYLIGENVFYLSLGSCAGALGALFSILTRVGSTPLDPSAGWRLHWLEGFGRILVGVLAAAFAQLGVTLGLVLKTFDKGHLGLFFIAVIAGASERLVPTLIQHVEMDGASDTRGKRQRDKDVGTTVRGNRKK